MTEIRYSRRGKVVRIDQSDDAIDIIVDAGTSTCIIDVLDFGSNPPSKGDEVGEVSGTTHWIVIDPVAQQMAA